MTEVTLNSQEHVYWRCDVCGKFTAKEKLKPHTGYDANGSPDNYYECDICELRP